MNKNSYVAYSSDSDDSFLRLDDDDDQPHLSDHSDLQTGNYEEQIANIIQMGFYFVDSIIL